MNLSPTRVLGGLLLLATMMAGLGSMPAQMPRHTPEQIFNVLDYGASRDGSQMDTEAFRRTIAAAHAAGGGTVYVPPGKYKSGPIELVSNMTLYVDAGATIEFPVAPLPLEKTRYLGVETLAPMALIGGRDVENVTVTGRGILTTALYDDWAAAYGPPPKVTSSAENANGPHWDEYLKALETHQPISPAQAEAAGKELRPSFIYFIRSKNILVENLRVIGAPMFVVHLLYSENATVHGMEIETFPGPHVNDIVVDSSRFVRISDDYIDTGDDGIVIKAGKDADGLRVNRPSEHVTITNCTVHHAHGAVVIGSETSGSIRDVTASNITAFETENGIRIKSRRGRGGVVEDVRFSNFTMENVGTGIVATTYYVMGGERETKEEPVSQRTPVFRNIAISNITINHAKTGIDIEGLPEMRISGLRLDNVIASADVGLVSKYTDALELHHVQVNGLKPPPFRIDSASNLLLDDVTSARPPAGQPVLRLTNSPGAILRDSRAFPGTDIFLSTDTLRSDHLVSNVLDNAKTQAVEQ